MEFAVTVSELLSLVQKLEISVNKAFERTDIIQDNIDTLHRLKRLYTDAARVLRTLEVTRGTDFITDTRLMQFGSALRHNAHTLTSLQEDVQAATVLKRVRRMKQVLTQCEADVKEFFQFLSANVSPALNKEAAPEHTPYLPDNNVPNNPPRLCLDYSSTATCEGKLKAAVLDESERSVVAVLASGQGGVGKTCALRGLASDEDIRKRFPDGTLYIQLGNESSILTVIQGITRIVKRTGGVQFAQRIAGLKTLQEASDEAAVWFRHHTCLILVDDIWWVNGVDSEVFTILNTMLNDKSRLVYTSRDRRFLGSTDRVIEFHGKEVRGELSRRMLMTHAGFRMTDKFDRENTAAFEAILDLCQGLPLAFGIAGASVLRNSQKRRSTTRQNAWRDFHQEIMTKQKHLFDFSAAEYGSLSKIVEMSLNVLELQSNSLPGRYQELFRALCVLEKKQTVPLQVLQKVWNLDTISQTEAILDMFYDVSIVQIWKEDNCISVQLHDLILDIAIRKASDKLETQEFFRSLVQNYISGNKKRASPTSKGVSTNKETGKNVRKRTAALLKWVKRSNKKNNSTVEGSIWFQTWWDTESDGYLHDNICRLLRKAGAHEDLIRLLSQPQWIVMRLKNGGIRGVERDTEEGRAVLRDTLSNRPPLMKYLDLIDSAARLSWNFVKENPYEAWFQLYARMVGYATTCEITQRFVHEIECWAPRPWVRASAGFIQPAGGPAVEVIINPGQILCVSQGGGTVYSVWRCSGQIGVLLYDLRKGTHRKLTFIPAEGEKEDSFFRRLVLRTRCAVISTALKTAATGHEDGSLSLWHLESGRMIWVMKGHTNRVNSIIFTAKDTRIVTGSSDATTKVWDVRNGSLLRNLRGHESSVTCVAASSDGTRIASVASKEGVIRVWDESLWEALSGQPVGYVVGQTPNIFSMAMNTDGTQLVSGSWNNRIQVWDTICTKTVALDFTGHQSSVECVTMSIDGARIVSGSVDGTVRIWDTVSGELIGAPLVGHTRSVTCISISEDGTRVVSGSEDETIRVWDTRSTNSLAVPTKCTSRVARVGVDKLCSVAVTFGDDYRVHGRLWDVNRGECLMTSASHDWRFMVDSLALSWSASHQSSRHLIDTGRKIVLATCEGEVRCFGDIGFSNYFSAFCKIER